MSSSAGTDERGATTIADVVVAKVASIAARETSGVHTVGGSAGRAVGALRERIPGAAVDVSQGESVEVGEKQVNVDVAIVMDYGAPIADVAAGMRRNLIDSVGHMTGLEVIGVDIAVLDIHVEDSEEHDDDRIARVR